MNEPVLLLFAKTPRAGHAKTRLAADVGEERALAFQDASLRRLFVELASGPTRLIVYAADADFPAPPGVELRRQEGRDLGERLAAAFQAFSGPVVVIGSDLPTVRRTDVERAIALLDTVDLVLGPAEDGGYWLLGSRARGDVFREVPWSSARVLEVTVQRAQELGWQVAFLDTRRDVDTGADLEALLRLPGLPPEIAALKGR